MVHPISIPSSLADVRLRICSSTSSITGRYGTLAISHVLLNWISVAVFSPACLAAAQCWTARGPGPTAEMEYSPTLDSIPPRSIDLDHSLTDISQTDFGKSAMMSLASPWLFQPQSDTITLPLGLP